MIIKKTILVFFLLLIISCSEKITYTGLIIDENINYSEINNKNDLLKLLGQPNYIDPIENNFYYFSEKNISKNSLTKKTVDRLILVYYFDNDKTSIVYGKRNFVYDFLSSMRQKINDPLGVRKKRQEQGQ